MKGNHLRDEISARADGEDPGISDAEIDRHIAECPSCREFAESTYDLRRRLTMVEYRTPPDMSRRLVHSIGRDERRRSSAVIRGLLTACAVVMIAVAVPGFVSTDVGLHSLRHVAAFRLAYAIGLLGVVVRPARARTMFHVSVVLVTALIATSVVDMFRGSLELLPESLHLVQILAAVLLWLLTKPQQDSIPSTDPIGPRTTPHVTDPRTSDDPDHRVVNLLERHRHGRGRTVD